MNKGWIKLHRSLQDCWIWAMNEPFDKRSAWIDLLLLANHADKKINIGGEPVVITKGQYHISAVKLSSRWGWSRNKVIRFLELLERDEMITTDGTYNGTTVTIVNYGKFQDAQTAYETAYETTDGTPNETPLGTTDGTADGAQTRIKELKNERIKEDKNNRGRFTPPTIEEVEAYCLERNNGIDAQTFIDFYSSKGWMIGKNKMKDWKAAVRTWERSRKTTSKPKDTAIDWSNV